MHEIQATLLALLPPNRKNTSGGWVSFNAVCCHHRGERPDQFGRGGVKTEGDGWNYHCFNCGFKAGWTPGKLLSNNTRSLFRWLGLSEIDVGKLALQALKLKGDQPEHLKALNFELQEKSLPEDSETLFSWAMNPLRVDDELRSKLIDTIQYVIDRGFDPHDPRFYWSPAPGYSDRVLIPFTQDGRIVGYTGRKITPGRPKYLTDSQSGYVFNIDRQNYNRQFVIVVEGQFDALAVDGVAIMTNEPNAVQIARINALGREVIVVPDRDRAGAKMIRAALDNDWAVSMPPWTDVKDAADALRKYGRLYTLITILHYKETNKIKIELIKKKLEALNE